MDKHFTTGAHFLLQYEQELQRLCDRYPIEQLYFFGSVLTDHFDADKSDVDVQVIFQEMADPVERGLLKLEFWDALEDLFGRKVDMLTEQPLQNPIFKQAVETTRQLFYDRKSQEVFA